MPTCGLLPSLLPLRSPLRPVDRDENEIRLRVRGLRCGGGTETGDVSGFCPARAWSNLLDNQVDRGREASPTCQFFLELAAAGAGERIEFCHAAGLGGPPLGFNQ